MSRTFKDKPDYLKEIKRNEEELNRDYLRSKSTRHSRFKNEFEYCLDCTPEKRGRNAVCNCENQSIEDLVTIYENSCVA